MRLLLILSQVAYTSQLFLHLPGITGQNLVFVGEVLDALLVLLLLSVLSLRQGFDLIPGDFPVVQDDISQLVERLDFLRLQDLLRSEQLLECPPHFEDGTEFLGSNQPPELIGQISNGLNVRDLPVEESAEIANVLAIKVEEVSVRLLSIFIGLFHVVLVFKTFLDEKVLARVDHFIKAGLDFTELNLLLLQFEWLFQIRDLALHLRNFFRVVGVLHFQIIVISDQTFQLFLE